MVEVPDKYMAEAAETARVAHGAARDDRDSRQDGITAELLSMVRNLQDKVLNHMSEEGEAVQELKRSSQRIEIKVDSILSAFPNKDPVGHLLAHEKEIKDAEKKDVFKEKMKFAFWALVMSAATVWGGIVAWASFLKGPKP